MRPIEIVMIVVAGASCLALVVYTPFYIVWRIRHSREMNRLNEEWNGIEVGMMMVREENGKILPTCVVCGKLPASRGRYCAFCLEREFEDVSTEELESTAEIIDRLRKPPGGWDAAKKRLEEFLEEGDASNLSIYDLAKIPKKEIEAYFTELYSHAMGGDEKAAKLLIELIYEIPEEGA